MAWSSVHTNAVLLIGGFLELETRLGRSCFLPSLFVSYFLKLDERFYRLREEVNLHPAEAYADFGSINSNFAAAVFLSFKIRIQVMSSLCRSCSFLMYLPGAFMVYLKILTPYLFFQVSMDPAMKASGARKRKKSLSPSNAVSCDSVDCRYVSVAFLFYSCVFVF